MRKAVKGAAISIVKKTEQELRLLPDLEWGRLAAYIDGEGCIRIRRQKRHVSDFLYSFDLELTIANTDPRLLFWLGRTFGGTSFWVTEGSIQANRRASYYWRCRNSQAQLILEKCLPFFVMKREQAELGILFGKAAFRYRAMHIRMAKDWRAQYVGSFLHGWLSQEKSNIPELRSAEKELMNAN